MSHTLFLLLNAPGHPSASVLAIATFFAEYVIYAIPAIVVTGWLRGDERTRKRLLEATASGLAALLINQIIGLVWQHPRPFMIGIGHTFVAHVADSSFPSDHLTLFWAVSLSLLMHRQSRMAGLALTLLGIPVAWARIYVGVHFPMDMAGAALVAVLSAGLAFREARWFLDPLYGLASKVHQWLFGGLIQRGLVQP